VSLTFVVPTIPGRESLLSRCLWSITGQTSSVLVVDGTGKLGDKLNAALQAVETDYVTVVDDDDYVTADYVQHVTPELGIADYVGFMFLELDKGVLDNVSSSVGDHEIWGRRTRGPVLKGVIRSDIARRVQFGNDYKADRRWSARARPLLTSWAFVPRALYVHDWWPDQTTFGAAKVPRDVGVWPHGAVDRLTVDAIGALESA
jgi:hypothetical protein